MQFVVEQKLCYACEECVAVCPVGAIQIVSGRAQIDVETCLCCGACQRECFHGAIKTTK